MNYNDLVSLNEVGVRVIDFKLQEVMVVETFTLKRLDDNMRSLKGSSYHSKNIFTAISNLVWDTVNVKLDFKSTQIWTLPNGFEYNMISLINDKTLFNIKFTTPDHYSVQYTVIKAATILIEILIALEFECYDRYPLDIKRLATTERKLFRTDVEREKDFYLLSSMQIDVIVPPFNKVKFDPTFRTNTEVDSYE